MIRHRIRRFAAVYSLAALPLLIGGCTPDSEQKVVESITTATTQLMTQLLGFALSFARQGLAAFLF